MSSYRIGRRRRTALAITVMGGLAAGARAQTPAPAPAAPPPVALTSTRGVYTMAEPVEFSVVLAAGAKNGVLTLRHSDGSVVNVPITPARGSNVSIVEVLPGALKPGSYTATAGIPFSESDHAPIGVSFQIARADNPNAYWLGAWYMGNVDAATLQQMGGWWYYSGGLIQASVRVPKPGDVLDDALAARLPEYSATVMGGGHQMDLNPRNDWSDPWVQRAVLWKMGLAALSNRFYPSMGIHAFDEPGLTWWDYPPFGLTPYAVAPQNVSFKHDTGKDMPLEGFKPALQYYHDHLNDFEDFMQYRMRFLNQAWTGSKWAVDTVDPKFVTINQLASAYAVGDVADGVDTTMDQAYDVLSGHGGYSDWAGAYGAVLSGETSHGFAWNKPHIYLPMWITADYTRMRQEAFLPWSIKEEGIMYDPNHTWDLSGGYADTMALLELAEVNHRMAMVGDLMEKLPRGTQPVAVLQSIRQYAWDNVTYNLKEGKAQPYNSPHNEEVNATARRVMSTGRMPNWIDESEVDAKGADFLKQWKVIYSPGLMDIAPPLRTAIEGYIAAGGKFIQNKSDAAQIPGSVDVDYAYEGGNDQGMDPKGQLTNDYLHRQWQIGLTPTFASDLAGWLGDEDYRSDAPLNTMLMTVHRAGPAAYILMGNDLEIPKVSRHEQHDPVSLDTTIKVPSGGVLYDLLNGGRVPEMPRGAEDIPGVLSELPPAGDLRYRTARLHLGPGDAAAWVHLPADPGRPTLSVKPQGSGLAIDVTWGTVGYLPFELTIYDPTGNKVDHLYRSTSPNGERLVGTANPRADGDPASTAALTVGFAPMATHGRAPVNGKSSYHYLYPLGNNAAPGTWTVKLSEWLNGTTTIARAPFRPAGSASLAMSNEGPVSIYMDDAAKIRDLFAGKGLVPPYDKMSWELPRVMNLDTKKFAVFGPADAANRIADALRAKGMAVTVNQPYEIIPFKQEPGYAGTGPLQDAGAADFENIYAEAIVLPGSDLYTQSLKRGHINRLVTPSFPGAGRAYIQWGIGGYQAGYEDVWAAGDLDAATNWILAAINGKDTEPTRPVTVSTVPARLSVPMDQIRTPDLHVASQIHVEDTPVGTAVSADGRQTFVVLAGGEVAAYDPTGKQLWMTHPLLQGGDIAVSPNGNLLAVGGYPGLMVLNAADGTVVGPGSLAPPPPVNVGYTASRIVSVAWNDAGTIAAGGWVDEAGAAPGVVPPNLGLSLVSSTGQAMMAPDMADKLVLGVRFIPGTNTLLVGGNSLTAFDLPAGTKKWSVPVASAQTFDFSADGTIGAAGGFGKNAATFQLADGKVLSQGTFENHVGGVALLPDHSLAVAVWGKTRPLYRLGVDGKTTPLFQDKYSFHKVVWSRTLKALIAGEEGGDVWVLNPDGTPRSKLIDAGTTPISIIDTPNGEVISRYDRTIQR